MTNKEKLEQETVAKIFEEKLELKLEMAYTLNRIYTKIDDASEPVIKHLILCFIFRDLHLVNHWKSEVYANLNRTYIVKGTNKFPTEDWFNKKCFDWLDSFYNSIDSRVSSLAFVEHLSEPKYNKDNLYDFVVDYFKWLYNKFSSKGEVDAVDVFNCIDNLLNKYSLM